MMPITEHDILEAVRAALATAQASPDRAPGVFTTQELAGALGLSTKTLLARLRPIVQAGRLIPVRIKAPRIDGIVVSVPAWQLAATPSARAA